MKFPEISGKFPDFRPATLLFPLRSHALVPLSTVGQGTKWRRNITENFNRLIRAHERWTDRRIYDDMNTFIRQSGRDRQKKYRYIQRDTQLTLPHT